MTVQSEPRPHPYHQRLGVRLAFALAISLLPLGLISGLQSRSLLNEAEARTRAALLGETLLAAADETGLIRGARTAVAALAASITALRNDRFQCSDIMQRVLALSKGAYSFVVFVPDSGLAVCTSNGGTLDLTNSERLSRQRQDPKPDVVVIPQGRASGMSVLAFGHPVFDNAGAYLGYVSISMPLSLLQDAVGRDPDIGSSYRSAPLGLITFDPLGNVLTSSTGLEDAPRRLPSDRPLAALATNSIRTFNAMSNEGTERIYAVFPLIDDTVFAIGSWPTIDDGTLLASGSPYLMPGLMWMASLLVAMLAAELLVTRHIRSLRKSITSFANGDHRVVDLHMEDASSEIRDVADAYLKMTDTIQRDSADLEDTIHQREVLLREVHHRVKNNLQLISSIMNMQMRQSHSYEARTLMKGLQDRVMSLATIHRGLYQTTGLTDVRADELLPDILRQILKMATGPGRAFEVETHFDDLRLTPDQAVPLSLLLTEALTNALKYAGTIGPGRPKLTVRLTRDGASMAILDVCNTLGPGPLPADAGTGLGSQLLTAFGQQLGAVSTVTADDGLYRLTVRFSVRSLVDAEAGTAAGTDDSEDPEPVS